MSVFKQSYIQSELKILRLVVHQILFNADGIEWLSNCVPYLGQKTDSKPNVIHLRMIHHHWSNFVSLLSDWLELTVLCCCVAVCYQTTSEFFHRNGNTRRKGLCELGSSYVWRALMQYHASHPECYDPRQNLNQDAPCAVTTNLCFTEWVNSTVV